MRDVVCPNCQNRFRVPAELIGRKGRCDKCQTVFVLEAAPSSSVAPIIIGIVGFCLIGVGVFMALPKGEPSNVTDSNNTTQTDVTEVNKTDKSEDPKISGQETQDSSKNNKTDETKVQKATQTNIPQRQDREVGSWFANGDKIVTFDNYNKLGAVELVAGHKIYFNGRELNFVPTFEPFQIFLPSGEHRVSQNGKTTVKSVKEPYSDRYLTQKTRLSVNRKLDHNKIVRQLLTELRQPREPYLLHLLGAYYFQGKQYEAAARSLKQNLVRFPTFAPSHFVYAFVLARLKQRDQALRELRIAEELNSFGAWGLNRAISELKTAINVKVKPYRRVKFELDIDNYKTFSRADDEVLETLEVIRQLAKSDLDRVAALNNMGLRAFKIAQYELAIQYFDEALAIASRLKATVISRKYVHTVLTNVGRAYSAAEWPEARHNQVLEELLKGG